MLHARSDIESFLERKMFYTSVKSCLSDGESPSYDDYLLTQVIKKTWIYEPTFLGKKMNKITWLDILI